MTRGPERRRLSAQFRMVLTVAAAQVAGAALTLGLVYSLMDRQIDRELRSALEAEAAHLARLKGEHELERHLLLRLANPDEPWRLLVETAEGDCPFAGRNLVDARCPFGNIPAWPEGLPADAAAPVEVVLDGRPMLVRPVVHPSGWRLLVGRDIGDWARFQTRLAGTLVATLGAATLFGAAAGLVVARRSLRRLRDINAFCAATEQAGLSRRLPAARPGDEFDRLAGSINRMLDRIAELAELNRAAADQIAHDMRAPLTPIRASLERMTRPDGPPPDRATLARLSSDLDRVLAMFAAIMEVSRIEALGRCTGEVVDLAGIAAETAGMYRPVAETMGVELIEDLSPAPLRGAPMLLRQAIGNLLSNALRYQEGAEPIRIRTGTAGGRCFVEVADRGPGIAEADLPRVCERLWRAPRHRHMEGHGMGLAFVSAVARVHGLRLVLTATVPGAANPGLCARIESVDPELPKS